MVMVMDDEGGQICGHFIEYPPAGKNGGGYDTEDVDGGGILLGDEKSCQGKT